MEPSRKGGIPYTLLLRIEMMIDERFHGMTVKTGCLCSGLENQDEHKIFKIGDSWFIEIHWRQGEQLFEMAMCEFCSRCNGLLFRDMPTTKDRTTPEGMIYVVTDEIFAFASVSREKAKNAFVERLQTFNNPYGPTARKKCSMSMIKLE